MGETTIGTILKNDKKLNCIRLVVLLLWTLGLNFNIQAQFTCDPAFYQIIDNDLLILNTVTGNYDTVGTAADAPEPINAAGYNRLDDHIYGLGVTPGGGGSGQLFRIEDDGSFTQLTSAPFNESSVSGDVDDNNHLWIRSSGNQGRNMKRISLDGTGATPYAVTNENFPNGANVLPGQVGGIADIVYIAGTELGTGTDDYIFAVSEDAILIIWEISTQTVFTKTINGFAYGAGSAATGNLTPGSSGLFGAGWTDRNGNLFFSNNGTSPAMGGAQASVWQITDFLPANSGTATATWITDSEVVTANDGAGCPLADAPIPSILDCTQPTAITGLSNITIDEGDNASFTVTGGSPGTLSWEITPTTGVSQATGTGAATGAITFANSGSYTITYTSANNTDPAGCNSTETSEVTAMITVNSSGPVSALTPFSCDNIFYQIIAGELRTYNPITGVYSDPIATTERYNATGYNRLDNYVYGIGKGGGSSPINNHLIRVGADGTLEDLGAITGFTAGGVSGDVDDSDNLWINIGEEYHRIENVSTLAVGGAPALVPVTFTGPSGGAIPVTTVNDVVFINGSLYGVNNNQELVIWNLGTLEKSTVSGLTTPTTTNFGAAFTDAEDRLYVSYNNGGLYLINDYTTGTPSESLLNNTVTTTSNDGFTCPLAPSAIDDDDDVTLDPLDLDVDGDGIPNIEEAPSNPYADADADGVFAYLDDDDLLGALGNVNGTVEPAFDTDSDGIPDFFDLDSDNDGIYDAVEAGHGLPHTNGVITGQETGSGANGLFDALEDADTTTPILQYTIANTSSGGAFDFQTTDADGDGCSDTNENANNGLADGNDGGQFGDNDPQTLADGEVDANGLVVAATYSNTAVAAVTDDTIFTACDDGDGVDAAVENAGPNGGDGNNDGIPDAIQPNVASIPDASGTGTYVTIELDASTDCATLTNVSALREDEVGDDPNFTYPVGLVDFTATCVTSGATANVTFYWHGISTINTYRKFGDSFPGAADATYRNFIPSIGNQIIDVAFVPTTAYSITDGLPGDDSIAPMEIVDPTGPALEDTDADSFANEDDLDDDNDGILDTDECVPLVLDTNVVVNGSMETVTNWAPPATDGTFVFNEMDFGLVAGDFTTNVNGWSVAVGTPELRGGPGRVVSNAQNGDYFAAVLDTDEVGFTVPVTGSAVYFVEFYYADCAINRTIIASGTTEFALSGTNGVVVNYTSSETPVTLTLPAGNLAVDAGATPGSWIKGEFFFVANRLGTDEQITFSSATTGGYVCIDNVSVRRIISGDPICDADSDGIINSLDLDSDGDGCPDAQEGTGAIPATSLVDATTVGNLQLGNTGSGNITLTQIFNLGTTVGTTPGVDIGVPTATGSPQAIGSSQNALIEICTDTDDDNVPDSADLDNDNDGILDTDEKNCPTGFVALGQTFTDNSNSGTIANLFPFSGADVTLNFELQGANVGVSPRWGFGIRNNGFTGILPDTQVLNSQPRNTDFPAGDVAQHTLVFNNGPFEEVEFKIGGLDGFDRIDIVATLAGVPVPVKITDISLGANFVVNQATHSVVGTSPSGANAPANSVQVNILGPVDQIVYTTGKQDGRNSPATIQLYEFRYCLFVDTDNDGIANQFDLDSDGDGCPDAAEGDGGIDIATLTDATGVGNLQLGNTGAGNTTITSIFNLGTTVGATPGVDEGVPTATGSPQGIGTSQNGSDTTACGIDNDNDGVDDTADLDDDNDGILDTVECPVPNVLPIAVDGTFENATGGGSTENYNGNAALGTGWSQLETGDTWQAPVPVSGSLTIADGTPASPDGGIFAGLRDGFGAGINSPGGGEAIFTTLTGLDVLRSYTINFSQVFTGTTATIAPAPIVGSTTGQFKIEIGSTGTGATGTPDDTFFSDPMTFQGFGSQTWTGQRIEFTPLAATVWLRIRPQSMTPEAEYLGIDGITVTEVITDPNAFCPDTDNDGIIDQFDLDSDGDGCPDLVEAGVPLTNGDIVSASVTNGNGVDATSNTTSTINNAQLDITATDSAPEDGLNDSIDVNGDGVPDYTSSFMTFALNSGINACSDTDGDTIADVFDLDDDNDGILDADECFIAATDECGIDNNTIFDPNFTSGVDNQLDIGSDYSVGGIHSRYANGTPASNCTTTSNRSLIVDLRVSTQHFWRQTVNVLPNTTYTFTYWARIFTATSNNPIRAVVFNDANVEILNEVSSNLTATFQEFTYTVAVGNTSTVRVELQGNNITTTANNDIYVDDIAFYTTVCSIDTDGDGLVNSLDLDSDGDGCPDALEGDSLTINTSSVVDATGQGTLDGGNSGPGYLGSSSTPVLDNLGNTIDNTAASPTFGVPTIAISGATGQGIGSSQDGAAESCIDSDGDLVADAKDLDDDNDGILDTDECPPGPGRNFSTYTSNISAQSTTTTGTIMQDGELITFTITHPLTSDVFTPGVFAQENRALEGLFTDAGIYTPAQTSGDGLELMPKFQTAGTWTFTFDQPITDLRINVWSLGDGGFFTGPPLLPELDFDRNVTLISSRQLPSNGDDGTLNSLSQSDVDKVISNDSTNNIGGNGTILVPGTYTTFSFDVAVSEPWWSFILSAFDVIECDTDRDGITDNLDLDSDGDGCPDAREGGGNFPAASLFDATGVGALAGGNTGGSFNGTATSGVINNLTGDYGGAADPIAANYVDNQGRVTLNATTGAAPGTDSTVSQTEGFSKSLAVDACADFDNDGVVDIVDVDDDNDGILDADECLSSIIEITNFGNGFLVPNGDFESGFQDFSFDAAYAPFAAQGDAIYEVLPRAGLSIPVGGGTTISNGNYLYIDIRTPTTDSFYSQTVTVTPNTNYVLAFYAATRNSSAGFSMLVDGTLIGTTGNLTTSWQSFNFTFNSGSATSVTISTTSTSPSTANNDVFLDDFYFIPLTNALSPCTDDFDNDGVINSLDLDSDGDGCPDSVEANVNPTIGRGQGTIENGSGGSVTTTTPNVDDAQFTFTSNATNDSNGDGLLDSIDGSTVDGSTEYVSTYTENALDNARDACADFDNDGIGDLVDIDDDNDGILDSVESFCLETNLVNNGSFNAPITVAQGWTVIQANVSRSAVDNIVISGGLFSETDQNDDSNGGLVSIATNNTNVLLSYDLPALQENVNYDISFDVEGNSATMTSNNLLVEIWNATQSTQTAVVYNTNIQSAGLGNPMIISSTFQIPDAADSYQIRWYGLGNGTSTHDFRIDRVAVVGVRCVVDTDDDGIPNRLDLDSDGDGCPDAVESGVAPTTGIGQGTIENGSGGSVTTTTPNVDDAVFTFTQDPGNSDPDTNNDGLIDSVDDNGGAGSLDGIPEYTSTYYQATSNILDACADFDNDGINDLVDIDDDNDGVLDVTELGCGFGTSTNTSQTNTANAQNVSGQFTNGTAVADYTIDFTDVNVAFTAASVIVGDGVHYLLNDNDADGDFSEDITITTTGASVLNTVSYGAQTNTNPVTATSRDNDQQAITLTWTPAVVATVVDPDNQLDVADGTNITSGVTINQTADQLNGLATWRIMFEVNLLTSFNLVAAHDHATANAIGLESYGINASVCELLDTDNDGLLNYQDLDSDGDGCPDLVEAGVSLGNGDVVSASVTNGNGTDATANTTSTIANAQLDTSGTDSTPEDGLNDSVDVDGNGIPDYTSAYSIFALDGSTNACLDSDLDGVVDVFDIDDDNDGILDVDEAVICTQELLDPDPTSSDYVLSTTGFGLNAPQLTSGTCWAPSTANTNEFVGMLFGGARRIVGVTTSGRGNAAQWVTSYQLEATKDGTNWVSIGTFTGNTNNTGQVFNAVSNPDEDWVGLRINPLAWVSFPCVRFQFALEIPCSQDTDDDGIVNSLDLDSDGDGCPDAVEAGVAPTTGIGNGDVENGTGGAVTSTTSTPNAFFSFTQDPGNSDPDTNNDGLIDSVDDNGGTGSLDGVPEYASIYTVVALDGTVDGCLDSDSDDIPDIVDIDDDNDGVLDSQESPSCFYNENEANTIVGITTPFGVQTGESTALLFDGATTETFNFLPNNQTFVDGEVIFEIEYITQVNLLSVTISSDFGSTGTLHLWGSVTRTGGYQQLTSTASALITTNNNILTIDQNQGAYRYYQIRGASNGNINSTRPIGEITSVVDTVNYQESLNPKFGTVCTENIDSDSLLNHLDPDSDGDGCSDAFESGATTDETADFQFPSNGTSGDANGNGLADTVEAGNTGQINYASTYVFATDDTLDLCIDTDSDGIPDLVDIDDDNDGVPDTDECFRLELQVTDNDFALDLLQATYHGVVARTETGYTVNGEQYAPDGISTQLVPLDVTPENGFNYTGQILLMTTGGGIVAGQATQQTFLLSTDGLFVYGLENAVVSTSLTTGRTMEQIPLPTGLAVSDIKTMNATPEGLMLLTITGDVWLNGIDFRLYGDGSTVTDANWHQATTPEPIETARVFFNNVFALSKSGNFYSWGSNAYDGVNPDVQRLTPTLVVNPLPVGVTPVQLAITGNGVSLSNTGTGIPSYFVLGSNGMIYSIGNNTYGQLGIGNTTEQNTWQTVQASAGVDLTNVVFISAMDNERVFGTASAILSDDSLLSWGSNNTNTIGGVGANVLFPTTPQGAAGRSFSYVENGGHITPATADGLYCNVGHNQGGGFGDGTTTSRTIYDCSRIVKDFASLQPLDSCNADGDSLPDHLDPDSDGDGCPDAIEAGHGIVITNTSNVGDNGLVDALELGGADSGILNYDAPVFLLDNATLNACTDTDGDDINDLFDLDDDNDGVLDVDEHECGTVTPSFDIVSLAAKIATGALTNAQGTVPFTMAFDNLATNLVAANFTTTGGGIHYTISDTNNGDYIHTTRVLGEEGSVSLAKVQWGPNLVGSTNAANDNAAQTIELSWSPGLFTGVVVDPDNQLDIANGTVINSGQTIVQNASFTDTAPPTWFIEFDTKLIPVDFELVTRHSAAAGDLRNEGYSIVVAMCGTLNTDATLTNSDTIPNHLDLDSDGDGCSDAKEAGATNDDTADFEFNISQTPAVGDTNANGLADVVENSTVPGTINYTSSYSNFALNENVDACLDTDGDDIADVFDIDDDNDGILDVDEAVDCPDILLDPDPASSDYVSSGNFSGLNAPQLTSTTSWSAPAANNTHFVGMLFGGARRIVGVTTSGRGNANQYVTSFELEATKDGTNWVSIGTFTGNTNNTGQVFNVVSNPDTDWVGLRINPEAWVSFPSLRFQFTLEIPCSQDTDDDGIVNSLDLDSDGDGCPDAVEAGVAPTTGIGNGDVENGTGGAVTSTTSTPNAFFSFTQDPGNSDPDTNNDGLIDSVDDNGGTGSLDGIPEYSSSYTTFALDSAINACTDSDGDNVADVFDVDDDNDGILDADEEVVVCPPGTFGYATDVIEYTNPTIPLGTDNPNTALGAPDNDGSNGPPFVVALGDQPNFLTLGFSGHIMSTDGTAAIDFTVFEAGAAEDVELRVRPFNSATEQFLIAESIVPDSQGFYPIAVFASSSGIDLDGVFTAPTTFGDLLFDQVKLLSATNAGGASPGADIDAVEALFILCGGADLDTDMDGIPNRLDLDSDGDGCPDAAEGDLDFEQADLVTAAGTGLDLPNNNNNDGSIATGYLGSTTESVLFNLGTTVDTDPASSTFGVPLTTLANTPNTQGIGASQDVSVDNGCCDVVAPTITP